MRIPGRNFVRLVWEKRAAILAVLRELPADGSVRSFARATSNPTMYVPNTEVVDTVVPSGFMTTSTCVASDLLDPQFRSICEAIGERPHMHRKAWEWAYIYHHLATSGVTGPGRRGIGYGVGREPLPAAFAAMGSSVLATDAPADLDTVNGWSEEGYHASDLGSIRWEGILSESELRDRVTYRTVDMNHLPDDLDGFDFCWSSCAFEHLGSLEAGLEFVLRSVELLRPGGVAVHTTEFNLSSNDRTLDRGGTVLYRRRDLQDLEKRLIRRGHSLVQALSFSAGDHYLDGYVDVKPYAFNPHLKLELDGFVTTSVGLVIRRGVA